MWSVVVFMIFVPVFVCLLNAILNRVAGANPHKTPFTAGFWANVILVPLYVLIHRQAFGPGWLALGCGLVVVLIYLNCVIFLNWFVFTLTDVSMHIQLMMQLAKQERTPVEQLVERYNKNSILGNRVPRLLELGQLRQENGRLFVSGGSVLFGASVCLLLRKILGIPERPEDADHFT